MTTTPPAHRDLAAMWHHSDELHTTPATTRRSLGCSAAMRTHEMGVITEPPCCVPRGPEGAHDASNAPVTYTGQTTCSPGAPRMLYRTAQATLCALDPENPP